MDPFGGIAGFERLEEGLYTAVGNAPGAAYDRKAKVYEALVSSALYNRIVWGVRLADYHSIARPALLPSRRRLLDVGCGGLVQTADAYARTTHPCVLLDNSRAMLGIAKRRLVERAGKIPDHLRLLQANAFDLPFPDGHFDAVCSFGMLHLFDDKKSFVDQALRVLEPGGAFCFTSMTSHRPFSGFYMRQLRKRGEFGEVLDPARTRALFEGRDLSFHCEMHGSMMTISGTRRAR